MVTNRRYNQNGHRATLEQTPRKSHNTIVPELLDDMQGSTRRRGGNLRYHKQILDWDGAERYDWFILSQKPLRPMSLLWSGESAHLHSAQLMELRLPPGEYPPPASHRSAGLGALLVGAWTTHQPRA